MINTHYRAKSNGLWVYGDLYNNCDRGVNQNFIVRDNEDIMLGSLSGKNTIGLKFGWLNDYFEQVGS